MPNVVIFVQNSGFNAIIKVIIKINPAIRSKMCAGVFIDKLVVFVELTVFSEFAQF